VCNRLSDPLAVATPIPCSPSNPMRMEGPQKPPSLKPSTGFSIGISPRLLTLISYPRRLAQSAAVSVTLGRFDINGPISAMIETIYGLRITEIEQSMQAVSLDRAGARRLRVDPGSPALQAVRRYYDASKRLVELAVAVHPGERFVYITRLRRQ